MTHNFNIFVILSVLTTFFTISVLVYGIFSYSQRKYSLQFIIFSLFAFITSAGSFATLAIVEYAVALKWSYILLVGTVFSPIALLILVIDFLGISLSKIKLQYKYLLYLLPTGIFILFLSRGFDIIDTGFGYLFNMQAGKNLIIPLYLTAINLLVIAVLGSEIHIRKKIGKPIGSVRLLLIGMVLYVLGQSIYQALRMAGLAIRAPSTAITLMVLFIFIFISLIRIEISLHQLSLSKIVDNIRDCIIITDSNGNILRINDCLKKRLFGKEYRKTHEKINEDEIKNKILEIIIDKNKALELFDFLKNDSDDSFNKDIKTKIAGKISTFNISVSTIYDKKNNSLGKLSIFRDITYRTRLEKRLNKSEKALLIKNNISNVFLTVPSEKMYEKVLEIILKVTESKYGLFGYIDQKNILVCPSLTKDMWDVCQVENKRIEFPHKIWSRIWGNALIEKKSFYSSKLTRLPEGHVKLKNAVATPIVFKAKSIGLLMIGEKASNYTKKDISILEDIASFIAPVLESRLQNEFAEAKRKKYEEEVEYLSFHDSLTGLYNRRYFEEELKRLDTERQLPISIIMADIDGLKEVNDKYGHNVGDKLLLAITKVLKKASRKEDIIARWGGDEFIMILPASSEKITGKIIERIKNLFDHNKLNGKIVISASLGSATKENMNQIIYDIVEEADKNMYENKAVKVVPSRKP